MKPVLAVIPSLFISSGPFLLSCLSLYSFLLLIMLHPFPAIDSFLEVNSAVTL